MPARKATRENRVLQCLAAGPVRRVNQTKPNQHRVNLTPERPVEKRMNLPNVSSVRSQDDLPADCQVSPFWKLLSVTAGRWLLRKEVE